MWLPIVRMRKLEPKEVERLILYTVRKGWNSDTRFWCWITALATAFGPGFCTQLHNPLTFPQTIPTLGLEIGKSPVENGTLLPPKKCEKIPEISLWYGMEQDTF